MLLYSKVNAIWLSDFRCYSGMPHMRNILNRFSNIFHSAHKWDPRFQHMVHKFSNSTQLITSSNVFIILYFWQGEQRSKNKIKKLLEFVTLFCLRYIKIRTWHKEVPFQDIIISVLFPHTPVCTKMQTIILFIFIRKRQYSLQHFDREFHQTKEMWE